MKNKLSKLIMMFFAISCLISGCGLPMANPQNEQASESNSQSEQNSTQQSNSESIATEKPTPEPTPKENRKKFSNEKKEARIKNFIDEDIDDGASISVSTRGALMCNPFSDKKTFIKGKNHKDRGSLQISPEFFLDAYRLKLLLSMGGDYVQDKGVYKAVIYNGSKKVTITSGRIEYQGISYQDGSYDLTNILIAFIDFDNDIKYLKKLENFKKVINSDGDIKIKVFYRNSTPKTFSETYKLNKYQIKTTRSMLKYFDEALTYYV